MGSAHGCRSSAKPGPRIALIQGSIDTEMQHDPGLRDRAFQQYLDLSRKAVKQTPDLDLIVWPEAMFLYSLVTYEANARRPEDFPGTDAEFRDQLRDLQQNWTLLAQTAQDLDVPLLLGVDFCHVGPEGENYFNSAAYVARDGRLLGRYGKMHLVMFGEYVPFAQYFPWLRRLTPLPVSVTPGERPAAFDLPWGSSRATCRIMPNICYESVLSHVIRGQVNALTAEGKEAGDTHQPHQRRLVLGLQRVGHAPGLRGVSGGGVPQAAADRRQHGFLRVDRWRRPHSAARPATGHGRHYRRAPAGRTLQLVSGPRRLVCGRVFGGVRVVRIGGDLRPGSP